MHKTIYVTHNFLDIYAHSKEPGRKYGNFGILMVYFIEYLQTAPIIELRNGNEKGKKKLGSWQFGVLQEINKLEGDRREAQRKVTALEATVRRLENP